MKMNKKTVCYQLLICGLWTCLFCFVVVNAATLEFNVEDDSAITAAGMGRIALKTNEDYFLHVLDVITNLDGSLVTTKNAKDIVSKSSLDVSKKNTLLTHFDELETMMKTAYRKMENIHISHNYLIETAWKWSDENKISIKKHIILVKDHISKINKNNSKDCKEVIDAAQNLKKLIENLLYVWGDAKHKAQKQTSAIKDTVEALYKVYNKLDEIINFVKEKKNEIGVNDLMPHLENRIQHSLKTVLEAARTLHEESQKTNKYVDLAFEKYTEIETSVEKLKKDLIMYKEGKNPKIENQQKETKLQTTDQQKLEKDKSHVSNEVNDFENVQQSIIDKESETTTLVSENQKNSNEENSELTTGKQEEKEQEGKEILESKVEEKQENLTPQQTHEQQQNNNEVLQQVMQNTSNTQQLKQKLQSIFGFYDGTSVTLSFATVIYVSCFAPVCMFFATLVA